MDDLTITKLDTIEGRYYLMITWKSRAFDVYIYAKDKIWRGNFSESRLHEFSRNMHVSESDYFLNVKRCLEEQCDDYRYEVNNSFFYWKRKDKDCVTIEGFLPLEMEISPYHSRHELIDTLLAMNKTLKQSLTNYKFEYFHLQSELQKCIRDTEEFLNLKIEMEKALHDKFLHLLRLKKQRLAGEDPDQEQVNENLNIEKADKTIQDYFPETNCTITDHSSSKTRPIDKIV